MNRLLILSVLTVALFSACFERSPGPPPPGKDDVLHVQDSIRNEILLRITYAQMEINRQTEMMRRRAYNANPKSAARLNRKIVAAEAAYEDLEQKSALLSNDSIPSNWLEIKMETDILIERASRLLQTPM